MQRVFALWLGVAGCWRGPEPSPEPAKPARTLPSAPERADSDTPPDAIDRLPGEWRKARPGAPEPVAAGGPAATPQDRRAEVPAVTSHDPARAWQGYNLYNSGHAPEAWLIAMDGRVLHRWAAAYADAFPGALADGAGDRGTHTWRKVVMDADGSLYAIWDDRGLVKLDKDSRVLWAMPISAHDDLELLDGGRIAVLAHEARIDPRYSSHNPVIDDVVEIRDGRNGDLLQRHSVLDAFSSATDPGLAAARTRAWGDLLRTNSLQVLDGAIAGEAPAFRRGLVLVSLQHPSAIALLDLATERFTWTRLGDFRSQHDAELGAGGALSLFDNAGGSGRTSRVRLFDPSSLTPVWTFEGTRKQPLRSATLGAVQQLPNGNVLITESDAGRAFEVTRDTKETVWELYNPHRSGEHDELIAALFEVQRLPLTTDVAWASPGLEAPAAGGGAATPAVGPGAPPGAAP